MLTVDGWSGVVAKRVVEEWHDHVLQVRSQSLVDVLDETEPADGPLSTRSFVFIRTTLAGQWHQDQTELFGLEEEI